MQWKEGVALLGSVFSKTAKEWGLQDAVRNLIQGHDWFLSACLANLTHLLMFGNNGDHSLSSSLMGENWKWMSQRVDQDILCFSVRIQKVGSGN